MAARPVPLSALTLCKKLATNSVARLDAAIIAAQNALETHPRLSASERTHLEEAIEVAWVMYEAFEKIAACKLPKKPKSGKRKVGRPSAAELEAAEKARAA